MEHIPRGDIGGRLRHAREAKGLSLADAARRTKLTLNVLGAIERNDFASLPAGMYRKAYIRTLATEVGLDPHEMAADYCEHFEPRVEPEATVTPEQDDALQEKLVEQLAPPSQRSIWTLAAVAAPAVAWFMLQPGPAAAKAPLDYAVSEPAAVMSPYASVAFTADPDRGVAPSAITARAATAPLQIALVAKDSCWVAAEADGERVIYRLMEPGERVLLDAQRRIVLRLGNAGSVAVSINGGASRSLGAEGQIVNLDLTPESVESFLTKIDENLQLN